MSCMCQYDSRVTGGEGSRMEIDLEKLKVAEWNVKKSGKIYIMESPPPAKKHFRSTKEVAEFFFCLLSVQLRCVSSSNARIK